MKKILFLLVVSFLILGCGIKRDNPLDPHANNLAIPGDVSGFQYTAFSSGTSTRYVEFYWNGNNPNDTDGYYIYRSLGYYNAYALVGSVSHVQGESTQQFTHSSADDNTVVAGLYYYRISAYKEYPAGKLEGRLSTPIPVRVPE